MDDRVREAEDWLRAKVREWIPHLDPDPSDQTEEDLLEFKISKTKSVNVYLRAKARLRELRAERKARGRAQSWTIRDEWCYFMVEEVHKKFGLPKVKDEDQARSAVGVVSAGLTAEGFTGFGYQSVRSHSRTGKEPFERGERERQQPRRVFRTSSGRSLYSNGTYK